MIFEVTEHIDTMAQQPSMALNPESTPPGAVCLRALADDDWLAVSRWLHADHVRPFWGDADDNLRLLRAAQGPGRWRAVIEATGQAVGLVMWQHPSRAELDQAGLFDIPTLAVDIDIMIGEPDAVGRGIGPRAITQVADQALARPDVPFVMACAGVGNRASQRAFEKAGFHPDRTFDDAPFGPHVLLVRRRHHPEPA